MKLVFAVFFFLSIVQETGTAEMNPFKFRKKTLAQFNHARRIVASGDISKILEVVKMIPHLNELYYARAYGPAADMYKLVWSRTLEQAAFEYVAEKGINVGSMGETLYHKNYIGFHWLGDIISIIRSVLGFLPEQITDKLNAYVDIVETLIIVLWMGFSIPTKYPLVDGEHFGAGELAFAMRYEIGCYSNVAVSICFMKNLPYQQRPFLPGGACSSCSTHCEFHVNDIGDKEEGELCVPPKGYYEKQKAEVAEMINSSPGTPIMLIILILIFILRK
ncbi:hypothetical protein B9Z55_012018 [Caenorhabditis nigoni]|uniref:SCP domain-containing protein n=1 Tax=Caenorhabditis nigoni TaxID=1611254 RepID=A0A2G5TVB9_9PELO|nr:hypothetical protein B9Z55_012018 [Caenorhabditis nigoni]